MTLHMRNSMTHAEFDNLIADALAPKRKAAIYRDYAKRALDITFVLAAAVPVVMILLVLAAIISLDGKSPFYLQKRVGQGGRIFKMWKLRSMVHNADTLLQDFLASNPTARTEWERTQKLRHDPRITRVGQMIRKTSLDELPQLWNVLRGDMSLVGPRPMMIEQQKIYPGTAYYALRPGITGFWQTSVRNDSSFDERAFFDTNYLREVSLITDLRVLARTVMVVVNGTGV